MTRERQIQTPTASIEIRPLDSGRLEQAATLLAHGMRDNPVHVEAFGADPAHRQQRLARFLGHLVAYVQANGQLLGACVDGELVGVLGMMKPGRCRPGLMDWLRFAGMIVANNPPGNVLRIRRWLSVWANNDPVEPHWHIGPLAVLPAYRRRGIGRRLMSHCCAQMDELSATAYLETDMAINVAFYETFGFVVIGHALVLGTPNWFMIRPPSRRLADAPHS